MKTKCEWCGRQIEDSQAACPYCGGKNGSYKKPIDSVPTTMEELKAWAMEHNLPLDEMRTYIDVDYQGPKAFGIYKDEASDRFIVYKNKADGTRSVRYEGHDEAVAVNELYQKMKERVALQKAQKWASYDTYKLEMDETSKKVEEPYRFLNAILVFVLVFALFAAIITVVQKVGGNDQAAPGRGGWEYYKEEDPANDGFDISPYQDSYYDPYLYYNPYPYYDDLYGNGDYGLYWDDYDMYDDYDTYDSWDSYWDSDDSDSSYWDSDDSWDSDYDNWDYDWDSDW